MRSLVSVALCAGLMGACASDVVVRNQDFEDVFQQSPTDQVDILFIVDNSGSMQLEQKLLAAGFKSFITEIEATGANFHIGVITTDFQYDDPKRGQLIGFPAVITPDVDYTKIFEARAITGVNGGGMEKGLEAASYALSPQMTTGPNAGFLRQDATLLVVIVSDEDDCSDRGALGADALNTDCYTKVEDLVPVSTFVSEMRALKSTPDRFKFAGIIGPEDASGTCADSSLPGHRYIEAARLTGGLTSSICESDWSSFLYDLGLNAAGIYTIFPLSHGAVPGTLKVFVDEDEVPESDGDGYTYDAVAHTIEFHGIWIPERGAAVKATYIIESGT